VIIDVYAAGVNFPDALIIEDKYQIKPERPFSPGGEVAGIVSAVGEGVERVKVGQRVIASAAYGGFTEKFTATEDKVLQISEDMPFDEASTFVMTYGTAYYSLVNRGSLKSGETLLVLGAAGGVGSAGIELGKALGARVVAAVSSEDKAVFAKEIGADEVVVYPADGLTKEQSRELAKSFKQALGGGADVVLDVVGGDYCEPALRSMSWDGRYLVVGFADSIPRPPLNLTLLKSSSIIGVFWGASVERDPASHEKGMSELLDLYSKGLIKPRISKHYPLADAGKAIREMMDRTVRGKLSITVR
jgi:NADPH2:quinone reductase